MTTIAESVPARPKSVFANAHFRNLWLGGAVSALGDQFYLVALPWLVLQLTGSNLAVGTVLMCAAVPRAVLMLGGGAVGVLAWFHVIQLWHLYILAAAFGTA